MPDRSGAPIPSDSQFPYDDSRFPADAHAAVALSLLPGWCVRAAAERLRTGASASAILCDLLEAHWPGDAAKRGDVTSRARAAIERAAERQIGLLQWTAAEYPAALANIADPPPVLWYRGDLGALARPAVAIVGSRAGSPYALEVAARLASDLAALGLAVISGLARGVDSAAHRGALRVGGATVAILGSAVDVMYPPEHVPLAADIVAGGGLVLSELVPGTPPEPRWFPRRNRLISGCCRAVVVVEAGEKSGSLITARLALEQGREVLAVPGNVLSGRNRGSHGLLRDGAKIVESADDIVEELGLPVASTAGTSRVGAADPLLACMTPGEPCDLDDLAARSGLTPPRILARLLDLQLLGLVSRAGGGRFVRFDSSC